MPLCGGRGLRLIAAASASPLTATVSRSCSWPSRSLLRSLSAAVASYTPAFAPATVSASNAYISPPSCFLFSSLPRIRKKRSILAYCSLRMASTHAHAHTTLPRLPIFDAISRHDPRSPAVVQCLSGRTFNYGELLPDVCRVREEIYKVAGRSDIRGERIAFLIENGYDYVVTFLAILAARAIALPLSPPFPASELQYIISHSEALLLLHSLKFASKAQEVLSTPFPEPSPKSDPNFEPSLKAFELPKNLGLGQDVMCYEPVTISPEADAKGAGMMLYTSGTTARPKGVLLSESALTAQCRALIEAWNYSPEDRLLHVLPLHHIHGTVNAILTPLLAGSTIEFLFPFNADVVWRRFANPFLEGPQTNGATRSARMQGVNETNGMTLSAPNANRIGQIATELHGIIRSTSGADGYPVTTGVTLSAPGTNRMSELADELNGIVRPRASTQSNGTTHSTLGTNGATHANGAADSGVANGVTSGMNNASEEDKFANMPREKITFFTVVPTVYTRLLSTHKSLAPEIAEAGRTAISPSHMRVSISGSAALPTPVKRAWKDLSHGNVLLERYGMTEVGMALSCGLDYTDRVDGSVGWPLPGVEARLFDTDTNEVIPEDDASAGAGGPERSGEIQLRGANVFAEYWANPVATAKEFVPATDGKGPWFKTGDVAVRRPVPSAGQATSGAWARGPMYFILGRQSADIIKSGGEKVSALEVERELLSLPEVLEAAVVAVPSGKWGQKVGAVVILDKELAPQGGWKPMDMRRALRGRLAAYKIPQVLRVVDHIPRNAMGKINKKDLVRKVFVEDFSGDEM